jgi:hypothetical protein
MGALKMFPTATNRVQSSGPCAKLILDAEIEGGALIPATKSTIRDRSGSYSGGPLRGAVRTGEI